MRPILRGTGYKYTLQWVFPYFAVWVVVLTLSAPVLTIAMMYSGLVPEYLHGDIWFFLFTRVPLMALAAVGLGIFSSARAAGPLVQLKRAFEDVTGGDLDRRLRFRRSDRSYRELEASFNAMMVVVGDPTRSLGGLEAEDLESTRPPIGENRQALHASPETSLARDS